MRSNQSPHFSAADTRYLFGTDSAPRTTSQAGGPGSRIGGPNSGLSPQIHGESRLSRFVPVFVLLAIMWVVEIVDTLLPINLDLFGLESWNPLSLYGLVTSPLLHSGFNHLTANTFPFLVLGIFIAMEGSRRFWLVTAVTALVSGLGAWLTTLPGHHIVGASGIVFGFFGYLAVRTWFVDDLLRKIIYFTIGLFVFVTYGAAMVFGMLPQANGISWQGHLFGFIGGVIAARIIHARRVRPAST